MKWILLGVVGLGLMIGAFACGPSQPPLTPDVETSPDAGPVPGDPPPPGPAR